MLAEEYVWGTHFVLAPAVNSNRSLGYGIEYQVSCQSTVCPVRHYVYTTALEALQQGPPQWSRRVLW